MQKQDPTHVARCRCGAVEVDTWAPPFIVAACYCDDCQAAALQLASSEDPVTTADGGSEFMLFRRDRIACGKGAEHLHAMRLREDTMTRRMVAACCTTPMYMAFDDKRPWVSAYRARFDHAPPVEMRICTRFRSTASPLDEALPSYPGYPAAMAIRLVVAAVQMLFSRPVGALP
jgi:hypothetical protein